MRITKIHSNHGQKNDQLKIPLSLSRNGFQKRKTDDIKNQKIYQNMVRFCRCFRISHYIINLGPSNSKFLHNFNISNDL